MSVFQRIATLTKAAIHEGLNKLEDPVLLTGQYLRDLEEKIEAAESRQRELYVTANVLERRIAEYQAQAERSEADAVQAMSEGNEAGARSAILAKLRVTESSQESAAHLEQTRQTIAELEVSLRSAKEEHTHLKAKRAELAERARKAEELAKTRNAAGIANPGSRGPILSAGSASRGFERMEDKIAEWEAHAEHSRAAASPVFDPTLSGAVEAELERLRKKNN